MVQGSEEQLLAEICGVNSQLICSLVGIDIQ